MQQPVVYLRFRERAVLAPGRTLTIGQIAEVAALPSELEPLVIRVPLGPLPRAGRERIVSSLQVMRIVHRHLPEAHIQLLGAAQTLVVAEPGGRPGHLLVAAFVWLLLFVGSAIAMMNFHADVNMSQVQRDLFRLVTGQRVEHPLWMEIPYSLGVGVGVLLFFGWLDPTRRGDPSPLELQVMAYEKMVDDFRKDGTQEGESQSRG